MKTKSVSTNAVLNVARTVLSILFPIITVPYVSRVLGAENLGKITFSQSIISYFVLIASLGISSYAVREGARIRNDEKRFNEFANQIFTINIAATGISYVLLTAVMFFAVSLREYRLLLAIQGVSLFFMTLGVTWIYTTFEDYLYITVRAFIVQLLSLILMFVFVKSRSDYMIYAMILVFSGSGMNILNFIHVRKYCKVRLTLKPEWKKHIAPIVVLFFNSLAMLVYVSSDNTILGLLRGDHEVGLYSVSVNIYSTAKQAIAALLIVSLPRLSHYLSEESKEHFYHLLNQMSESLMILALPAVTGLFLLSERVVLLISGEGFRESAPSLRILSFAILFSIGAMVVQMAILIPNRKEKVVLIATVASATENIILNFLLIPTFGKNGAAFTTLLAEITTFGIGLFWAFQDAKHIRLGKTLLHSIVGCGVIVGIVFLSERYLPLQSILWLLVVIVTSAILYMGVLLVFRNPVVMGFTRSALDKVKRS